MQIAESWAPLQSRQSYSKPCFAGS